jgi:hypothetical protein
MNNRYYLSFVRAKEFLGACIVEIEEIDLQWALLKLLAINPNIKRDQLTIEMAQATVKSHRLKINPGGAISIIPIASELTIPEQYFNRLLSRAEVDAMNQELLAINK